MLLESDPRVTEALVAAMRGALERRDEVEIAGLGVFRVEHRSARLERTPDGSISLTPPRREIVFSQES